MQVVHIPVAVHEGCCPGGTAGIDQAAVVEAVAEDGVLGAYQCGNGTQVGHVAGRKGECGLCAQKTGDGRFQLEVWRLGTADQARGRCADAEAGKCCGRCFPKRRVVCQAEVIVGTEQQACPVVDLDTRILWAVHQVQATVETSGFEVVEFG